MTSKPHWKQPRLIDINPFGGSTVNPYEYDGVLSGRYTLAFTGGLGDNTTYWDPPGNITDFDFFGNPSSSTVGYRYSTIAPYS